MSKKTLLIIAAVGVVGLAFAGGTYVLNIFWASASEPASTPDPNDVKYQVVGTSMAPTLKDRDWLLVRTDVKTLRLGNLVVMRDPGDQAKIYCRRVVGVSGDRVVMRYYPNVKLTTVYSPEHPDGVVFPANVAPVGKTYGEYDAQVSSGSFYVVGDNTVPGGSYDSDEWGLLSQKDVVGVVKSRLSPNPKPF